jgi:hypothetical protein
VGGLNTGGYAYYVAVSGQHVYVANSELNFQIIDVSDPSAPQLRGTFATPDTIRDMTLAGRYIFLANADLGLRIIDVSDPDAPWLAGSFNTVGAGYGVAVSGQHAYVADGFPGVSILQLPMLLGPPTLNITRSDSNVTLSWPLAAADFMLDQASALEFPPASTIWSEIPAPYQNDGTVNSFTVPLSATNTFYRLRKP